MTVVYSGVLIFINVTNDLESVIGSQFQVCNVLCNKCVLLAAYLFINMTMHRTHTFLPLNRP